MSVNNGKRTAYRDQEGIADLNNVHIRAETNDSSRRWVQDALEDDEVREALKRRRTEVAIRTPAGG